jgi:hypothetical protein
MREQLGDHAGALETYRAFAERLVDEFGAMPSSETQALYARLQGNEGLHSPQLSLFAPEHITWVHAFPWWWVSQLRNAPAALAVVAYLRTLEAGGSNAFDLPPRGHEAVGMTNAAFEDALKTLLQGGIIDAMGGSVRRRFTFVFEEPRANRERRNETRPRRTSTA